MSPAIIAWEQWKEASADAMLAFYCSYSRSISDYIPKGARSAIQICSADRTCLDHLQETFACGFVYRRGAHWIYRVLRQEDILAVLDRVEPLIVAQRDRVVALRESASRPLYMQIDAAEAALRADLRARVRSGPACPPDLHGWITTPTRRTALRQAIQAAVRDDQLYAILAPWQCGCFDGGCLMVADALQRILGGERYALLGARLESWPCSPTILHAVVRVGDYYVDGDGPARFPQARAHWATQEHTHVHMTGVLEDPALMITNGTPYDPQTVDQLEAHFRRFIAAAYPQP